MMKARLGHSMIGVTSAVLAAVGGLVLGVGIGGRPGETVRVELDGGEGTFADVLTYSGGCGSDSVAVGDLNGDRALDLVVLRRSDGMVSVFFNDGAGAFGEPVAYQVTGPVRSVALRDLDLDGDLDVILTDGHEREASVLVNRGEGNLIGRAEADAVARRGVGSREAGFTDLRIVEVIIP